MKYFMMCLVASSCVVSQALAQDVVPIIQKHSVDREDQKRVEHLGLDDPEFFELWFGYWHERRLLVKDMLEYSRCVGEISALYRVGGWADFTGENKDITEYWDVIPAVPLEERPKDFDNAREHIKAAKHTRELFQYDTYHCYNYRDFLNWYLGFQ